MPPSLATLMSTATIGVIGLGNMGRGIADNLIKSGREVLAWDAAAPARKPFEKRKGVRVVPPGEMAQDAQAILFVVPGTAEIRQCLHGRDGILAHARKGLILCDLTTSDPEATKRLAQAAAKRGIAYIDAGMSGGAVGAQAGTLTLMVGGDKRAFAKLRPHLECFAKEIHYLGGSGAGHTMKVLHQIVCHANFLAAAETLNLGERAGLDLGAMLAVINSSNGRSYASEVRFPRHVLTRKWDGRSRVYNLYKDLRMALAMGRRLKGGTRFAQATLSYLSRAMGRGMADEDFTLLYRDFDALQTPPRKRKAAPKTAR